jgi:HTH-type transcriptional regulator/antitoxin HigA
MDWVMVMKDMGDIRSIRDQKTYLKVVDEIARHRGAVPKTGSYQAQRIDLLLDLVEAYEARELRLLKPTALEAIRHFMRQRKLIQADLAFVLGSRSRASELLSGKRKLTMAQAWKIHKAWHLLPEALIRPEGEPWHGRS